MKKSWNLPSSFPDLEKVLKMEMKSEKMVKRRVFFWRQHVNEIFFVLVKSYSISSIHLQHVMKKALFLHFKVYVDHLFDNLKSGKRNYCFGKKSRKSLVIDPKICMNPGSCIQCVSNMFDMLKSILICSSTFKSASCWLACASPSDSRDVAKSRSSENWVCMIWETDQIWRLFSLKNGPGMVTL